MRPPSAIDLAARALGRHDRSRQELDERLQRAGIGEAEREAALGRLEEDGYLDDERLAIGRAETLAARGQGDEAIRFDLTKRGIGPEVVEAAVAALEPEAVRAAAIADRVGRTARTVAQLRRKGFSEEALQAAAPAGIAGDGP
jgi:SOS response regulatory protein OraA/RecX